MRVVITRPQSDGERTAAALRARGHEVLVTPLMRVEPVTPDLHGKWGAVIITSANAPKRYGLLMRQCDLREVIDLFFDLCDS